MKTKKEERPELVTPVKGAKLPKTKKHGASGDTNESIMSSELKNNEHGSEQPGR